MAVSPRIGRFLRRHRLIGVDTMVFIYHFEHAPGMPRPPRPSSSPWRAARMAG